MKITKIQIIEWLEKAATLINDNKAYLTELDAAIGDADHGSNMARGFKAVVDKLPTVAEQDIGTILKTTGMTLLSQVGGASGPLYGTFFLRAAAAVTPKETLDSTALLQLFEAGVNGIQQRGRAETGDKTMIDAWLPGLAAFRTALAADQALIPALEACVIAAEQGMQATIPLRARKGRASYLGERSVGHQDPGATSTVLILKALYDILIPPQ